MPYTLTLCLHITKCLKVFILHAGLWGFYKRFCSDYTAIRQICQVLLISWNFGKTQLLH